MLFCFCPYRISLLLMVSNAPPFSLVAEASTNNDNNDEDFEEENLIQICYAWDNAQKTEL